MSVCAYYLCIALIMFLRADSLASEKKTKKLAKMPDPFPNCDFASPDSLRFCVADCLDLTRVATRVTARCGYNTFDTHGPVQAVSKDTAVSEMSDPSVPEGAATEGNVAEAPEEDKGEIPAESGAVDTTTSVKTTVATPTAEVTTTPAVASAKMTVKSDVSVGEEDDEEETTTLAVEKVTKSLATPPGVPECKVTCPDVTCGDQSSADSIAPEALTKEQKTALKKVGDMKKICGKTYYFSRIRATFEQSYTICCGLNTRLVVVDNLPEMDCLISHIKATYFFRSTFWAGGTDLGCQGQFSWCPRGERVNRTVPWQTNQPNALGVQRCLSVQFDIGFYGSGLDDQRCEELFRFICEA